MSSLPFTVLPSYLLLAVMVSPASGQVAKRERPAEWKNLVTGGQFKDLILPMPVREGLTNDTWGGDNVKPRDVRNGIEDPQWSYWCGFPVQDTRDVYHLFTARWPEDHPDGHFGYFDSEVAHATSSDPLGPYVYQDTLGEGHNPELYRSKKGNYIVYSTHGRYFISKSLDGPWKRATYDFHKRERYVFKNYVNFSFAPRDDGSCVAVSRRGYIWASPDGEENWYNTSAESVYPTHVPFIIYAPGVETTKHGEQDILLNLSDVLPSVAEVMGAKIPADYEINGQSFWPWLTGNQRQHRGWIYAYRNEMQLVRGSKVMKDGKGTWWDLSGEPDDLISYRQINDWDSVSGFHREERERLLGILPQFDLHATEHDAPGVSPKASPGKSTKTGLQPNVKGNFE